MISMCFPAKPSCEIIALDSTGGQTNQGIKRKGVGPCYQQTTLPTCPMWSRLHDTSKSPTKIHKTHLANSKHLKTMKISLGVNSSWPKTHFFRIFSGISSLKKIWVEIESFIMTSAASCTLNRAQLRSRESSEKRR